MPSYVPMTHRDVAHIILTCAAKQGKPTFTFRELRDFLQPIYSAALLAKFDYGPELETPLTSQEQFIFPYSDRLILNEPEKVWAEMQKLLGADAHLNRLTINSEASSSFYLPAKNGELNKTVLAAHALICFCVYKESPVL